VTPPPGNTYPTDPEFVSFDGNCSEVWGFWDVDGMWKQYVVHIC